VASEDEGLAAFEGARCSTLAALQLQSLVAVAFVAASAAFVGLGIFVLFLSQLG